MLSGSMASGRMPFRVRSPAKAPSQYGRAADVGALVDASRTGGHWDPDPRHCWVNIGI